MQSQVSFPVVEIDLFFAGVNGPLVLLSFRRVKRHCILLSATPAVNNLLIFHQFANNSNATHANVSDVDAIIAVSIITAQRCRKCLSGGDRLQSAEKVFS